MYQLFRILLPIFPSLVRLRGGAGHPELRLQSARSRGQSRQRPSPEAPRLHRAPGSETPRPIISHIISLSPGQQIPINLLSKLFPILDQATSACGGKERASGPHAIPICSSSFIPSHTCWNDPDPISSPRPRRPKSASHYRHSTFLSSHHPQRVRTGGPEGWGECGGVFLGRPPLPMPHPPLNHASLCSPSPI